ncbi:Adenosylcobinamide-GDP ribazoletransferase [Planktothrix tepida]|uniref:Adenosylcobinamide-GDP ribazoletransferase n=2 Tax=Planktothrix TaxID=54304 RepID=A0A1J1LN00_9CYAN|nr:MULTISPECIES: adenosylcobinamide-GDP ribazoletransferase [Planktothrix]CAD5919446.1 Adenosylcobinamide-GDP ribazoletransferase [Planktothrix pseudagardhii]CAD5981824.1 Adenosylcobinamide-GDP ribazoletransferase [Planktothrix tepida]CUR33859.1 Cobalamin synthase [Planktothrix tepida PCC 9214]
MSDNKLIRSLSEFFQRQGTALAAAIAFYTCFPIPLSWTLEFRGIARFAPVIGVLIGGILGLIDGGLFLLGCPVLTRSVLVILAGIGITGGLHLDGAMDTADGLAVADPNRRLEVMADSVTGAFGVMAAIAIILLKVSALQDLSADRGLILMAVAGWGRWGQLVAIARYPYLKATGKGAFHKDTPYSSWDLVPGALLLIALSGIIVILHPHYWLVGVGLALGGSAIAILSGAWFNARLGGHTGDTYGAVVEWTEAFLLVWVVALQG